MWIEKLMISCKVASHLASEGLDHKLPLGKRIALKVHLSMCKMCLRYQNQIKGLREVTFAYMKSEEASPLLSGPALPTATQEKIKSLIDKGDS